MTAKVKTWMGGFSYTFENGYVLSCAIGPGSYSDNKCKPWPYEDNYTSSTMEVAVIDPQGDLMTLISITDAEGYTHTDSVVGWVPAELLPKLLLWIKIWDKDEPETNKIRALSFGSYCDKKAREYTTEGHSV